MNPSLRNLNRIEFLITLACTGRCKHCSEGDHSACGGHIPTEAALRMVERVCGEYNIQSLMTFGGEPLLFPEVTCAIQGRAAELGIPKRQLITNGFFSREEERICRVAEAIAKSGVNDLLLSVDAFHQETIPLMPVMTFARALRAQGVPLRISPAWLTSPEAENPYNRRTHEILAEFLEMGIPVSAGNIIFPAGNARVYLAEYFPQGNEVADPYLEDPTDLHSISVDPDGSVLGGNICRQDILDLISAYRP